MELENEPDTVPIAPTAQQPDRVHFAQQPADKSIAPQQMHEDNAQQPGSSQAGDDIGRKRERTLRSDDNTDVKIPEAKVTQRRPKRTREELMKEIEEIRKNELDTGAETESS